ncbi:TIR domain-containing protein [Carnobacterium maltaromaticum]|uniref:TIR domain-containing protein n=1 Tax=Carnobacterium maltaromaticum TaxID=2751 RepID=UPI00295E2C83|nr:TIR domain-containing protein [Carnobacterium maltaromaticum]
MHKTFISYHHANDQDLKDEIIKKGVAGGSFVDKSVSDGDINIGLAEETIMKRIREDYLQDSTVIVVIIGEETFHRPYINSEIQAGLWGDAYTGLIGVVRDEIYDRIYSKSNCTSNDCNCGVTLNSPNYLFSSKIPDLIYKNHFLLEDDASTSPHFENADAYCSIYKYSTFFSNMEKYIDEAFDKRQKNYDVKKRNSSGIKTITNPLGH